LPFNIEVTGTCPSILKLQELALQYRSYRNLPFNIEVTGTCPSIPKLQELALQY
jgi:hypothetical protein